MQSLRRTLEDHDLGHLRIVAELWEVNLPPGPARAALTPLVEAMLAPGAIEDVIASLPAPAAEALDFLLRHGGRAPLADLTRTFGPMRAMGPGKRDREKPWLDREAALDGLHYRGMLARAFADTPTGPLEFGFIPQDLFERLPRPAQPRAPSLGRPAPGPSRVRLAAASAMDDATTLLAALRRRPSRAADLTPSRQTELAPFLLRPESLEFLATLLVDQGVLRPTRLKPEPNATRQFLGLSPDAACAQLRKTWLGTRLWNDLAHTPGLSAGAPAEARATAARNWPNDPALTRMSALSLIQSVPMDTWWDLAAFIDDVAREQPAFQRPGGDFDSWYLLDILDGRSLRGFDHWDAVEGRFLRFLFEGPLTWLGTVDLGFDGATVAAFRKTALFADFIAGSEPRAESTALPEPRAEVSPDGLVRASTSLAPALRYQIARFATWVEAGPDAHVYRVTPSALAAAKTQGLNPAQVRTILERASGRDLPPGLITALARWGKRGAEGRIERILVLETSDARVLRELQADRSTARYLGDALGPTAVRVRAGHIEPLLAAAARRGILIEPPLPPIEDA
jgi:Helicase conserved C-terminal domain